MGDKTFSEAFADYVVSRFEKIPKPTPVDLYFKYRGRVIHQIGDDFYLQPKDLPTDH